MITWSIGLVAQTVAFCVGALRQREANISASNVVIYPEPTGEPHSTDYQVSVNGRSVFVYTTYGYDETGYGGNETVLTRPVTPVSFASFDFQGAVNLTVRCNASSIGFEPSYALVRPLVHNINALLDRSSSFNISIAAPGQYTIEPDGVLLHPLHIFANPLEVDPPNGNSTNVTYYGPGIHYLASTNLTSHSTIYVAGGAVLYLAPLPAADLVDPYDPSLTLGIQMYDVDPLFYISDAANVTIRGRGILCGRKALERFQRASLIATNQAANVAIEGVVLRESTNWATNFYETDGLHVNNVKVLGHWVNNDGFVLSGNDAVVENSFAHNADDAFQIKAFEGYAVSNITFRSNIAWASVGGAFVVPSEVYSNVSDVLWANLTVIHATDTETNRGAVGVTSQGPGTVTNMTFANITIEDVIGPSHYPVRIDNAEPDSYDIVPGTISNIVLTNITVIQCELCEVLVSAYDNTASVISDITFDNVDLDGQPLADDPGALNTQGLVNGSSIRSSDSDA